MVEDAHLLEHGQVEFVVVLGHLAKTYGVVFVDDASDLEDGTGLHQGLITFEFDDFHCRVYEGRKIKQLLA